MTADPLLSIPRQVPNVDIRRLPIGPEEAYVISRIDGNTTLRDIGYATGFEVDKVRQCVETLERLGAIDYAERPFNPARALEASRPPAVMNAPEPESTSLRTGDSLKSASSIPPSTSHRYDPSELLEECDLEPERKARILELYYQLETLDHYHLIGVQKDADRKAVKAAYFDQVKVLHPDRYFGKNLGSFREKLERCFSRLTDAHETLTDPERRAEYDDYLQSLQDTEELERSLEQTVSVADLDALERRLTEAVFPLPGKSLTVAIPDAQQASGPASVPPLSCGRQLSEEDRKRALARKLRLSSPNLRIPSQSQMAAVSIPPREQIAEQLKRQYEQSRHISQQGQLASLLKSAEEAMSLGDPVKATNHLRTAQSLAPNDDGIAQRLTHAQSLATTALADTYLKQAEYEDKSGRWEAAARSYERAARGRPTASTWEAAARCLLEAKGDMRAASDYARKAIALDPERATSHLLLGRIFISAKMRTSALSELERARSLDPNNDTVSTLLARLQRESL